MLTTRLLPPAEWSRLAETGQFGAVWSQLDPRPSHTTMIAVEEAGRIVGTWGLFSMLHVEGLWCDPAARGVAVNRRLLLEMRAQIKAAGASCVLTCAADGDTAIRQLLHTAGGTKLPETFVLPLVW